MRTPKVPQWKYDSSRSNNPAPSVRVRRKSPYAEYETWETAPSPQGVAPISWTPLTGVANKISSWMSAAQQIAADLGSTVLDTLQDVGTTAIAAATGKVVGKPGRVFETVTEAAEGLVGRLPASIQRAAGIEPQTKIAGYITTADGKVYPVTVGQDVQRTADNLASDKIKASLRAKDIDLAIAKLQADLKAKAQADDQDRFSKLYALKERQAALNDHYTELRTRALEIALEREQYSSAQRALWGRPSTIDPEPPTHRTVKQVGAFGGGETIESLY